jgi:hypothetical protein
MKFALCNEMFENQPVTEICSIAGPASWQKRMGGRKVLVPTPLMADEVI